MKSTKTFKIFCSDALNDANAILKTIKDSENSKALIIKGDALYNLGDFEHSLVNYYQALKNSNAKVCISFLCKSFRYRQQETYDQLDKKGTLLT